MTTLKTWSTPEKPEVWAKFQSFAWILSGLALTGNAISGYYEYKATSSFWEGVLTVGFLEGATWIASAMFFSNVFVLWRNIRSKAENETFDYSALLFTVIGAVLLFNIVSTSIQMSVIGNSNDVIQKTEAPTAQTIDSSEHNTIIDQNAYQLDADTLKIFATLDSLQSSERQTIKANIKSTQKLRNKIRNYADYTYEKYGKKVQSLDRQVKSMNKELRNLNSKYEKQYKAQVAGAKSKYSQGLTVAKSALLSSVNQVDSTEQALRAEYLANLNQLKSLGKWKIYLGIGFTLLFVYLYNQFRHLARSYPEYENPFEGLMSPFAKMRYGTSLRVYKGINWFSDKFIPNKAIIAGNKPINIQRKDLDKTLQLGIINSSPLPSQVQEQINYQNNGTHATYDNILNVQSPVIHNNIEQNTAQQGETPKPIITPVEIEETPETQAPRPIVKHLYNQPTEPKKENNIPLDANRVEVNEETAAKIIKGLSIFDYDTYLDDFDRQFKKMAATKEGKKRKTHDWEKVAQNRLNKISILSQLFVSQGFKVQHINTSDGYGYMIDKKDNPTLANVPAEQRKVEIFTAPNGYKLPIFWNYPKN